MNREHKYRAQRVGNGEWVYGHYYTDQLFKNGTSCVDVFFIRDMCHEDHEVREHTVGQYTGMKDVYGGEIYEGDVTLEVTYCPARNECNWDGVSPHTRVVAWQNKVAGFWPFIGNCSDQGVGCSEVNCCCYCHAEAMQVIGNIYDNPEYKEEK